MSKSHRRARKLVRDLKTDTACASTCPKPGYSAAMEYALGEVEVFGRLGPEGLARHLASVEATA